MDSQPSDPSLTADRLQSAIWHRAWDDAATLAAQFEQEPAPSDPALLRQHLQSAAAMLIAAREGKAELQAMRSRIRAVSGFERQDFAETPES